LFFIFLLKIVYFIDKKGNSYYNKYRIDIVGVGDKDEGYMCWTCGKIERYHLTEKNGEVEKRAYLITIEEANYNLRQRISYYNNYRQHTGI
jgi:hypothetical protein